MNNTLDKLQQVNQLLEKAFFAPLHLHDWLSFCFGHPFLLGMEEDEIRDLYYRSALAQKRLTKASAGSPLASLWNAENTNEILANALASLKDDRPFFFHRALKGIPAVKRGDIKPEQFDKLEHFLIQALADGVNLREVAGEELEILLEEALKIAGGKDSKALDKHVNALLSSPQLQDIKNESQLRLWISAGSGGKGIPESQLPRVLVKVWYAWCGAITGAQPNAQILNACQPFLDISFDELEQYLPLSADRHPALETVCPYCDTINIIEIREDSISATQSCPHLIFIGTEDEIHLIRVLLLSQAQIGEDVLQLLDSYYHSSGDLELFSTIVNDLYEMLLNKNKISQAPVKNMSDKRVYSYLKAHFTKPAESLNKSSG